MLIRRELPQDIDAIRTVHRKAFHVDEPGSDPIEVRLVDELRADGSVVPECCFVAEDDGRVVGHVAMSLGSIDGAPEVRILGLAPFGVLPEWRREGAGGGLIQAALGAADALGFEAVVLLGHAMYYQKFGFVPTGDLGIDSPVSSWPEENFQIRTLTTWSGARGTFHYAPAFRRLL